MKTRSTFLLIVFLIAFSVADAQSELFADFGPPEEANVWTQFTIELSAETFSTDETTFDEFLANITSFWIRTEMHTGDDVGGIDDVYIGTTYSSDFNASADGWSSGGDGTMEWMSEGGHEGGYLMISDWAIGEYHYLIAPSSFSGDWTSLKGQNIQFWYKTDRPSYAAHVKITRGVIDRLVINTVVSSTILPDDSVMFQLEVLPAPAEDITVTFSSSDQSCITVPDPITIPAGHSTANVYFTAAPDAEVGCQSVIEATSPGYLTSRVTIKVLDNYGVEEFDLSKAISIFPNPCNGKFMLSNTSNKKIQQLVMYDLSGNAVLEIQESDLSNTEIEVPGLASGMYFLRIFADKEIATSKVVVR